MAFIKPEIYGTIVTEKIKGKVVVSNLADDLGYLSGDVGDTVSFPMFEAIGEAKELTKGQGIDEAELKQVDSKATIKQVAAPGRPNIINGNLPAMNLVVPLTISLIVEAEAPTKSVMLDNCTK